MEIKKSEALKGASMAPEMRLFEVKTCGNILQGSLEPMKEENDVPWDI